MQHGSGSSSAGSDGEASRRGDRDSLLKLASIHLPATGETVSARVRNVSSGGLMAQASEELQPGVRVEVELEGMARVTGAVAWSEAGRIGIAFDHPVDRHRIRAPRAVSAPALMRPVVDGRRPPLKSR